VILFHCAFGLCRSSATTTLRIILTPSIVHSTTSMRIPLTITIRLMLAKFEIRSGVLGHCVVGVPQQLEWKQR
jgi:hypothetical protein